MPTAPAARRTRLGLEPLEDRSVPSSTPVFQEAFQNAAAGGLPAGWVQWTSNHSASFAVARTGGLGDLGALTAAAPTGVSSRTWVAGTKLVDAEVSAAVFLNSLTPAQLLVRGRNLDTGTPTYYAVSITRGLVVTLDRVVTGRLTTLGSARSGDWVSNKWVQVSLRAEGNVLSVQVRNTDTGRYLTGSGDWVSQPVNALQARDTAIASEGQVGVGRGANGADRLVVDGVRVLKVVPEYRELLQAERFDNDAAGSIPDGWAKAVGPGGSALVTRDQLFQITGPSKSDTRAWIGRVFPADLQVSSSLYADSLVPARLMLRGQHLGTAYSSYYAVSVTRGLNVQIVKVVGGRETVLGTVSSRDWVSGQWVQVSLVAKGAELRAQVFRTDTGQYLRADGTWGLEAGWALARTDSSIAAGGMAGVGRGGVYAGSATFDNFIVSSAPARWDEGSPIPTRNDKPTNTPPPPSDSGGTPPVPTTGGGTGTGGTTVTNPPTVPRNLDWIRLAQLAYNGTPFTDFEVKLLKDYVDLVIPNAAYLDAISATSPTTPLFVYTNLSNVYLGLLTDWLAYADRTGVSREAAFYHVNRATAFSGTSSSAVPVDQFWGVFRGSESTGWANLTHAARSGAAPFSLAPPGGSVAVGYTEKFRELGVQLKSSALLGWTGRLEYVTAVDAQGRPTAWGTLNVLKDGTAGFRASSTITFDPPKDWVAASIGGSARLFYVRVKTISNTGTAPVVQMLRGRDYTNQKGITGTVPAFDYAADGDGDGYLNDAEYGRRAYGKDARFAYEGRLIYPTYGPNRFATNVSNPAFQAWAADYHARFAAAVPKAAGFFVDNSLGKLATDPAGVRESMATYSADYGALLGAVNKRLAAGGKWLVANTAGGGSSADPIYRNAVSALEEFALRPLASNYVQFEDLLATLKYRRQLTGGKAYEILDSLPVGGDPTDPRTQVATLAMYYTLADPNLSFLMMNGGNEPSSSWTRHFTDAVKFNVGKPKGSEYVYATGKDPSNTSLDYKVYARDYTNALVLYKPLAYTKGMNGSTADSSATTVVLGGPYRQLRADGTLGAPISRVTLRNGEGAILARA